MFSINEVIGSSERRSDNKKELLQIGLKMRKKYFLPKGLHCVNVVPGNDGIFNLFALASESESLMFLL